MKGSRADRRLIKRESCAAPQRNQVRLAICALFWMLISGALQTRLHMYTENMYVASGSI
jgi:hypothetical protein